MAEGSGLRIVVLTRRGRCASARAAVDSLAAAGLPVAAVVAEPWLNLVFSKGILHGLRTQFLRHGWSTLRNKLGEQFSRGSGQEPLSAFCEARGIAYVEVADHNAPACAAILGSLQPDLIITANTRIILPRILRIPKKGGLNIHKSLLPRYAGLESIFWALYQGEKEVGVTIHCLAQGLDTGAIMAQTPLPVGPGDDLESLDRKADAEAARLLAQVITAIRDNKAAPLPQDESQRTYFSWPTPAQRRELAERLASRRASQRLVIINADDFGLTRSVNQAVVACHEKGVVTSATLMANAPAFDEAVALAKAHPSLGVGLHFNLTLGTPLCPPDRIPSLVDASGAFFPRRGLELKALLGRVESSHVALELEAQYHRLAHAGLKPTHIDGHQHCHVLPGVLGPVADFCRAHGLGIRCPRPAPLIRRSSQGSPAKTPRSLRSLLLKALLSWQWPRHARGLAGNDSFTSVFDIVPLPSRLAPSDYAELLAPSRVQGAAELMVHPSSDAGQLKGLTRIGDVSEAEYAALLAADVGALAAAAGGRLGHYGDLRPVPSSTPMTGRSA
ncbi:MAG: ChbG/HpnK family deacetylase [Elusimicrobia bacterium]|nr:ChbG/HpnK family deacetylase [Elusimicrobiota bacterium]